MTAEASPAGFPATGPVAGSAPLDGILVADLSRVLAGPYCTMLLADMGATVIKVESAAGDDTRGWTPPDKDGVSTYFMSINRNKRSIVLDFRDPADVALVHELFRRADIAIENFKPGALTKFGLDHASARALNPALVYASISGFGTAGGAELPGYDLVVQAVSGLMSITGEPDGDAIKAGISVFDVITGLHATVGILAALHHRSLTGEGQLVELNLLSCALSGLVNQTGAYTASATVPSRMGNAHPSVYPYEVFSAKDRDMIIAAANDRQFKALCEVLGIGELVEDERFRLNADRTRNRGQMHPRLQEAVARHNADDLFSALNEAGVPCGPINSIREGIELAERLGLEPRVTLGTGGQAVDLVRNPIRFSNASLRYDHPPPDLGEHSDEIRAWLSAPEN